MKTFLDNIPEEKWVELVKWSSVYWGTLLLFFGLPWLYQL